MYTAPGPSSKTKGTQSDSLPIHVRYLPRQLSPHQDTLENFLSSVPKHSASYPEQNDTGYHATVLKGRKG